VGETVKISGRVIDIATNESLPGVNVTVKGTQNGTITDVNGSYSIEAWKDSTLVFSFIGYQIKEVKVGTLETIDVGLSLSVEALDEVVVIGYGTTTKKEVTGSIATIKTEEFNQGRYSDPMGLIQGKVAGLSIMKPANSDPMGRYQIMLRGTNTMTLGQEPLVVVDGIAGVDLKMSASKKWNHLTF
jgi:iron complex outermembrane receptor protein